MRFRCIFLHLTEINRANILDTFSSVMLYGAMDDVKRFRNRVLNTFGPEKHFHQVTAGFVFQWALIVFALLSLSFTEASATAKVCLEARLVSSTLKILPDSVLGPEPARAFRITAVRNEYAPFQVAVSGAKPIKAVTIDITALTGASGSIHHSSDGMFLVESVPVEKPSIPPGREATGDKPLPVSWPDPLPPLKTFSLEANKTRSAWVDLFIPAHTRPGLYKGAVLISAEAAVSVELPIEVDVRSITIPVTPSLRTAFGNTSLPACLEKAHGVHKGSSQFQELLEEYYWFLVKHRLSPYHIPVDIFSQDAHRFLDDPRITSFVVPVGGGAGEKGHIWDNAEMKRLSDRLEQTGWIGKGIFYVIDEPSPEAIPDVIRLGKRIHAINPRFQYLMTPHSGHLLFHKDILAEAGINVWAPLLTVMSSSAERKILLEEQKQGKQLWWYTCVAPKWRGMNYFIDEGATAPRLHPWMNCLYGNEGILYWATDNWTQVSCDPWQKTDTYPTGAGDGSLLYPGRDGYRHPVASIRLKMLREGLEDYELLKLLAVRLKEAASNIGGGALNYRPEKRLFEHAFALITEEGRTQASGEDTPYLKYVTRDYRTVERQRDLVIEEVERAIEHPLLLVDTVPCDNGYTSSAKATVSGYAETGASIQVNGAQAQLKENMFDVVVTLVSGPNILTITAVDRAGRTKTVKRTINNN
jgi:hypothetical protein